MAKYKLFRKSKGEWYYTNLYNALKALLEAGEPLRSKDLNWVVSSWHNFVPLMRSVTPDGDRYFDHKLGEDGGSYWSVSEEGYRDYVNEIIVLNTNEGKHIKTLPKPDYLVNKVHTYEAEIEESVNLLKKHGYKVINEADTSGYNDHHTGIRPMILKKFKQYIEETNKALNNCKYINKVTKIASPCWRFSTDYHDYKLQLYFEDNRPEIRGYIFQYVKGGGYFDGRKQPLFVSFHEKELDDFINQPIFFLDKYDLD